MNVHFLGLGGLKTGFILLQKKTPGKRERGGREV